MTEEVKQLSDEELKALREVKVSLDLEGLWNGWKKLFYKVPFNAYQTVARKIEGASKKMMTGNASVIGFPLGIILRNTSRTAHNSTKGGYSYPARIVGGLTALAAAVYAAPILAGAIGGAIGFGTLGAVAGWIAAGTAAVVASVPVFTATTLAVSTATAAVVAGLSTVISAPLNFIVGLRRSKASLKGIKLTQDQIAAQEEAFDRRSPTVRHHNELAEQIRHNVSELPTAKLKDAFAGVSDKKKKEIFEVLKADVEAIKVAAPTV